MVPGRTVVPRKWSKVTPNPSRVGREDIVAKQSICTNGIRKIFTRLRSASPDAHSIQYVKGPCNKNMKSNTLYDSNDSDTMLRLKGQLVVSTCRDGLYSALTKASPVNKFLTVQLSNGKLPTSVNFTEPPVLQCPQFLLRMLLISEAFKPRNQ